MLKLFVNLGIYQGMLEFSSETGIKLALLIVLLLVFFMVFAALKLISAPLPPTVCQASSKQAAVGSRPARYSAGVSQIS